MQYGRRLEMTKIGTGCYARTKEGSCLRQEFRRLHLSMSTEQDFGYEEKRLTRARR